MGDVRELEDGNGSEFEAIIDDLDNWPSIKLIAEYDRAEESIYIHETWALINESIEIPDVVICPVGGGGLLSLFYHGLLDLKELGIMLSLLIVWTMLVLVNELLFDSCDFS